MYANQKRHLDPAGLNHECGVFGCVAAPPWPTQLDVANIISLGLVGLQHRGQESAGIATGNGGSKERLNIVKGMGLVGNIYCAENLSKLNGNLGIGHTRYSTEGRSELQNCQPFVVDTIHGNMAVAHNGELVNKKHLRDDLLMRGIGLSSSSDSEVITQILCIPPSNCEVSGPDWYARIKYLMEKSPLAYSLLVMNGGEIYAARDPFGNRPLCIGVLSSHFVNTCEGWIVSSESCVFQSIGATLHREILPGEIVKLSSSGLKSLGVIPRPNNAGPALCIFEYVYFARPDTVINGQMVYSARKRCGHELAIESPVEADIVSCVPESSSAAAFGYSEESNIPFVEVLAKNRYVGRTFIQPSNRLRQLAVSKKFGPLRENLAGKKVILIDDSIVRGNTMGPIVQMLREGGAKEVHIRIASPPIKNPCYMGINIPNKDELIANRLSVKDIAKLFNADSLTYLSISGLLRSVKTNTPLEKYGLEKDNYGHCIACLDGKYPVKFDW